MIDNFSVALHNFPEKHTDWKISKQYNFPIDGFIQWAIPILLVLRIWTMIEGRIVTYPPSIVRAMQDPPVPVPTTDINPRISKKKNE